MGEIAPRRTAVFIGQEPKCIYLWRKPNFPKGETCTPIYDLGHAYPMKTAIRLGAISPITGCPVWYDGIRKPGMRIRVKPSFTYLATLSHP